MATEGVGVVRWSTLVWVGLSTCLVLVLADFAAGWLAPPHRLREVEDAVVELRRSAPTWLVIGSSHARTFSVVGQELWRRTQGQHQLVSVPVEFGKMTSYHWVLQHRLRPWLEEKGPRGDLRRSRLKHVLLVTEWWDTVPVDGGGPAYNLPARAWELPDFLKDVWHNGLTSYNQNYIRNRWMRLWSFSALMQDRGHGRILAGLRQKLRPLSKATKQQLYLVQQQVWQTMVDQGSRKMLNPTQMTAFSKILNYFQQRHISVSVLLYPRMPATITAKGKRDTLVTFATAMRKYCQARQVRLVDLSYQSPLRDIHFTADFDHVTHQGNQLFTRWALQGPLRYLLDIVALPGGRKQS